MGWGTESCPKVEKIFVPGNQYVTAAKMILQNSEAMISIVMLACPSEVLVIVNRYASPVLLAADLLSQAEHGPDSQVVLVVAGDGVDMKAIEEEISKKCQSLPRGEYASKALSHSFTAFACEMVEVVCSWDRGHQRVLGIMPVGQTMSLQHTDMQGCMVGIQTMSPQHTDMQGCMVGYPWTPSRNI